MNKLTGLLCMLALAACGGGHKQAAKPAEPIANTAPAAEPAAAPAPETPIEHAMNAMRRFEAAMCSCKDADCAKHVSDDMTAWSQAEAQKTQEPVKMTEADQQEAIKIGTHMGECMQSAMGMGGGSTP